MSYIENEDAYNAAIARRIKANSWKTNKDWINQGDNAVLVKFLENNSKNKFYGKLFDHYNDYGKLSDGQVACVRKGIVEKAAKIAERAAVSTSQHVGIVGVRQEFSLTIVHIAEYQTNFSYYGETGYVYVCTDTDGSAIVYRGSKQFSGDDYQFAVKGDKLQGKATVKSHEMREGIAQTIVARPAFRVVREKEV